MSDESPAFTKIETAWGESLVWDRVLTDEQVAIVTAYLALRIVATPEQGGGR